MKPHLKLSLVSVLLLSVSFTTLAQTREQGPWWPHPIWGAGDQAGGSNWITPEKVLQAMTMVKTGKVYELGQPYENEMSIPDNRSYNLLIPSFPTYGPEGRNGQVFNDEYIAGSLGQIGTQFDGPGHVGQQVKMADGTTTEVFYNGYSTADMKNPFGLQKLGVENVKPIVTRGVLVDIAGLKGVPTLAEGYEVSLADVKAALTRQGMTEASIAPGDALFFNFGWSKHWDSGYAMQGKRPYVSREVVDWIITKKPCMVGSDGIMDGDELIAHSELTMKNGIFNLEWMTFETLQADKAYEFLFVFTPIRFKGATGSPGRPIAIR
jgi:kynurenine formamidase